MASPAAHQAADAVLMALSSLDATGEVAVGAILQAYGDLSELTTVQEVGRLLGEMLGGHVELELALITMLVYATHMRPDDLLRKALSGHLD